MFTKKIIINLMIIFLFLLSFCFTQADLFAQRWAGPRDYEPIVIKGEEFSAFLGQPVSQIFAYAYDANSDVWEQVPLQIDEKDDSTHVWVPEELRNGVLDLKDELVFMARDMGDEVNQPWNWIDDPESRQNARYQIVATDPNSPESMAYIYFYLSSTITDLTEGYMSYKPDPEEAGADTVFGVSYVEGHTVTGIPSDWIVTEEGGGTGVEILDRQKARASGYLYGFLYMELNEDALAFSKIDAVAGKVRVSRRLEMSILGLAFFQLPIYYYPYSIDAKGSGTIDPSIIVLEHFRISFDLNSDADSMQFHNNNNTGIYVDGIPDTPNKNLVFSPEVNWYMIEGDQGSLLALIEIAELAGTELYFYDNSAGGSGDGTDDTGDGDSWGDFGIEITAPSIEGRLVIPYTDYFLPANQDPAIASEFVLNFKNPLDITQTSQLVPVELATFDAVVVDKNVVLSWRTLSESNNYGFEIQRKSASGNEWEVIGFVEGSGTATIPKTYQFVDERVTGNHYFYRLKQIDFEGSFNLSSTLEVFVNAPASFALFQNYPNPFNPETVISYHVPNLSGEAVRVELTIYNLLGDEVATVVKKQQTAGYYNVRWNGRNSTGQNVSAGTYIYQLKAGDFIQSKKMLLLR